MDETVTRLPAEGKPATAVQRNGPGEVGHWRDGGRSADGPGMMRPSSFLRSPIVLQSTALITLSVFFVHDYPPKVKAQIDATNGICERTQEVQDAIQDRPTDPDIKLVP